MSELNWIAIGILAIVIILVVLLLFLRSLGKENAKLRAQLSEVLVAVSKSNNAVHAANATFRLPTLSANHTIGDEARRVQEAVARFAAVAGTKVTELETTNKLLAEEILKDLDELDDEDRKTAEAATATVSEAERTRQRIREGRERILAIVKPPAPPTGTPPKQHGGPASDKPKPSDEANQRQRQPAS